MLYTCVYQASGYCKILSLCVSVCLFSYLLKQEKASKLDLYKLGLKSWILIDRYFEKEVVLHRSSYFMDSYFVKEIVPYKNFRIT